MGLWTVEVYGSKYTLQVQYDIDIASMICVEIYILDVPIDLWVDLACNQTKTVRFTQLVYPFKVTQHAA